MNAEQRKRYLEELFKTTTYTINEAFRIDREILRDPPPVHVFGECIEMVEGPDGVFVPVENPVRQRTEEARAINQDIYEAAEEMRRRANDAFIYGVDLGSGEDKSVMVEWVTTPDPKTCRRRLK